MDPGFLIVHGVGDRDGGRDTEPLREGLPRLRYRIDLEANLKTCEAACLRWAPHLWFGRIGQRRGTQGLSRPCRLRHMCFDAPRANVDPS